MSQGLSWVTNCTREIEFSELIRSAPFSLTANTFRRSASFGKVIVSLSMLV